MNFDEIINRKGTYCTQWDYIEDRFGAGTKDLTPFSISDTDFKCPQEILDVMSKRLEHGIFGYSRWNHDDYKNAIKNWYKARHSTEIKKDWIVYSPNVIYSLSILLKMLVTKNGKVMTHTPKYDGFTKILKSYCLFEITLKEDDDGVFHTDFALIEEGFKKGVKAFILCNPENPTGKVWKYEELKKLIELCGKYDVILISDDIHMDIVRKRATPVLKIDTEKCLIVSSPTKTFNTASLGGSYAIIPQTDIREKFITHLKEVDSLSSPTIFGILSTIVAYNHCGYWVDELNSYLTKNCEYVKSSLNGFYGIKVNIPEGTYLMWIDLKNCHIDMEQFKKALIDEGKVAIMSGETYGDKNRIRLNVGCPLSKVRIAVEGIKKAIEKQQ
ncbi:aminotransferase class I/II-fold pyridoxal phosphate-dependent enzyme [Pasteurella skyensis]|uniref:cysteine-S-conjugate beta-lyase n=1 Tax=Phocoenobacter skyensis TaxID=97481 RepID=A0AAJ6NA17_9PAST|nr:aminotransferase class I/II-fold pyridoxal phosphate-dependent enzyme [Pasteurella skyensis]MDP8162937.1 aminotransferase class I/II-fold pyridoxal phosphate-dependent enzyme [Pasteurella skyensis]MDP8172911.1 aminotransferase class I/II-fold pyridoxal phosphate-dependent enzyme [Pasteurella skyensis]MDP8176643.1 aminotransferase class I/II-fold pyridoxal phosphate-dependent enzyme [Pasteurella skyensis]MDP8179411.1 aminotransferase class I/II-fold pyridoxal phosphate-dependent enzyme [Paste